MPFAPVPHHPRSARGFTLIELMIAVAIVAILASLALPAFQGALRKSRRAEAITALSAVQLAQERWRANKLAYSNQLTNTADATPPGLGLPGTTPSGNYTVSLSGTSATGYAALATAVVGTSQADDGDCAKLSVRMNEGNLFYGSAALAGAISDSAAGNKCWAR